MRIFRYIFRKKAHKTAKNAASVQKTHIDGVKMFFVRFSALPQSRNSDRYSNVRYSSYSCSSLSFTLR